MNDEIELIRLLHPEADVDVAVLAGEKEKLGELFGRMPPIAVPSPADLPCLIPHLIYEDVAGAIDWLHRAFGFRERELYRHLEPDGAIGHAEMQVGGALIMLGPPSIHADSPRHGVSAMLHVYVENVDRHYERARAAGAKIVVELADMPWGDRRYQAADPEGHQWQFAQRIR